MSMEDLARRAVACKRWRWMPGMKARTADSKVPVLVCRTEGRTAVVLEGGHATAVGWWSSARLLPDLTDPATLGCLLHLVREAWGDRTMSTMTPKWEVWFVAGAPGSASGGPIAKTEAEALVAALEAAPCTD